MRSCLCPYCFESVNPTRVSFRCVNPDATRCPLELDNELAAYHRLITPQLERRVFSANGTSPGVPVSCRCGTPNPQRVCPRCHNTLPNEFGALDSYTIALIGASEAGKSHYIAVLIHELTKRVGHRFNASLNALDDQTTRRYHEEFERHLYTRGEIIKRTLSARANIDVRSPLVYRFSLEQRKFLSTRLRVASITFFDTAGEDLKAIDIMSTETRYIANSNGIIFLLDPLQIPAVGQRLMGSVSLPAIHTEPNEIIGRVAQLIRQHRQLRATTKIDTPVALAFSKIDAVRRLMDPGSPINEASDHDGFFDLSDAERVNDSMRAYVAEWVGPDLDVFLRHNFRTFGYFGLSALGAAPDEGGQLRMGVAPFRVEDPFLWILYRMGIIAGKKRR